MKKITKLSLIAALTLSSTVYADTLAEAFATSKVKGEIKAQYFNIQSAGMSSDKDNISVVGGNLNLVTGSFNGLKAGVTFQTSHVLDLSTEGTNVFAGTMDASGSVMSEAYLSYTLANTTIKVGRQYITTPLVAGSGSRMIKQSFEGLTLVNTDIPNTTVVAAYVDKFQGRTDSNGDVGEFDQFNDGAYTLYAKNTSVKDLTLQAQYLDVKGMTSASDKDVLYADASYNFGPATVSAQVIDSTDGTTDGRLYGLKASGNVGMVNLTGLYTTTTDDGKVYSGAGGGADSSFTALPVHAGGVTYEAQTDTMVGVAATKLAGATLVAYYGVVNTDNFVPYSKIKAFGGFVQYAFNKNFSTKVMYESADFDTLSEDDNVLRVYTSYKF
jgi:hypothetical protein